MSRVLLLSQLSPKTHAAVSLCHFVAMLCLPTEPGRGSKEGGGRAIWLSSSFDVLVDGFSIKNLRFARVSSCVLAHGSSLIGQMHQEADDLHLRRIF